MQTLPSLALIYPPSPPLPYLIRPGLPHLHRLPRRSYPFSNPSAPCLATLPTPSYSSNTLQSSPTSPTPSPLSPPSQTSPVPFKISKYRRGITGEERRFFYLLIFLFIYLFLFIIFTVSLLPPTLENKKETKIEKERRKSTQAHEYSEKINTWDPPFKVRFP